VEIDTVGRVRDSSHRLGWHQRSWCPGPGVLSQHQPSGSSDSMTGSTPTNRGDETTWPTRRRRGRRRPAPDHGADHQRRDYPGRIRSSWCNVVAGAGRGARHAECRQG